MANISEDFPIQVATIETPDDTSVAKLDVNKIKMIIQKNRIEDIPVVIVAVAGMARKGKSFLLNILIAYLKHISRSPEKEFKASPSVISGLNWAGGRKAVTKGIWIWEEAFIIKRSDNSKVAILLLDTQGICDGVASARAKVDSQIIYMTLSMATIYIHNVDKEWKMPERKVYQICKTFSDVYGETGENQLLFNSITLLYRNWVEDEQFGIRPDVFDGEIEYSKEDDEAFKIVSGIDKLFHHKTAWVLPEPSDTVRKCPGNITLADIGDKFLDSIDKFSNELFSPTGHYQKHMDCAITGRRFVERMEELSERLKVWPDLAGESEQLKDIYLRKAYNIAAEWFEDESKSIEIMEDIEEINDLLGKATSYSLEHFKSQADHVQPYDKFYCHYYEKLKISIEKKIQLLIAEAKRRITEKELQEAQRQIELQEQEIKLQQEAAETQMILQAREWQEVNEEFESRKKELELLLQQKNQGLESQMEISESEKNQIKEDAVYHLKLKQQEMQKLLENAQHNHLKIEMQLTEAVDGSSGKTSEIAFVAAEYVKTSTEHSEKPSKPEK